MDNPLVSIVTPSYNQAQFIRATIESVLQQDYSPMEYLVIDGGSTDGTVSILKEYDSQLKWVSEPDNGQSDAINKGFRAARGEIIGWMNSDDTYEPGAVRRAIGVLNSDPEVGLVYGDVNVIDAEGRVLRTYHRRQLEPGEVLRGASVTQATVFLRKSILEQVGLLDPDLHYCMDTDLWFRCRAVTQFRHIPAIQANIRKHAACKTRSKRRQMAREYIFVMRPRYVDTHWYQDWVDFVVRVARTGVRELLYRWGLY